MTRELPTRAELERVVRASFNPATAATLEMDLDEDLTFRSTDSPPGASDNALAGSKNEVASRYIRARNAFLAVIQHYFKDALGDNPSDALGYVDASLCLLEARDVGEIPMRYLGHLISDNSLLKAVYGGLLRMEGMNLAMMDKELPQPFNYLRVQTTVPLEENVREAVDMGVSMMKTRYRAVTNDYTREVLSMTKRILQDLHRSGEL